MKTANQLIVLLLFFSLTLTGCYKSYDNSSGVEDIVSRGNWIVNYYYENEDLTGEYQNYRFVFTNTGSVSYTLNADTFAGTWRKVIDANKNEFLIIDFNTHDQNIEKLNQEWKVISRSNSILEFESGQPTTSIQMHIARLY